MMYAPPWWGGGGGVTVRACALQKLAAAFRRVLFFFSLPHLPLFTQEDEGAHVFVMSEQMRVGDSLCNSFD